MDDYLKILKKRFGYDRFRDQQLDIINAVLKDKKDVCVIMFTGGGKSLCYQFPPVYLNKTALIISPLISLMDNQKMKLDEMKIPSVCLNGTVRNKSEIKEDILENSYRLVYTTPEFVIQQEDFIKQLVNNGHLCLVAIDEAHSISNWGHEFRKAYKSLNCIKSWVPDVPVMALTATATDKVQADIIKSLKLKKPFIVKTTFDRPNLVIKVLQKTDSPMIDIIPLLKGDESTIIYCQTRKMTDELSTLLKRKKITSESYHAGMDNDERDRIHREFMNGKISCICATVAFGMGIDATIRQVIHYGTPKDMESYYQEIGRAGRDGKKSFCYILYSVGDTNNNDYLINQISNSAYRDHRLETALVMKNYIFSQECRRKFILNYFGEKYPKDKCNSCDNCINNVKVINRDFSKEGMMLIKTVNDTGGSFGSIMLINVLRGSKSKKVPPKFAKLEQFGSGDSLSDAWWKIFIKMLINNKFIKEKPIHGGHGFTLYVTKEGDDWYKNYKNDPENNKLILMTPKDMIDIMPEKKHVSLTLDGEDDEIEIIEERLTLDEMIKKGYDLDEIIKKSDQARQTIENKIVKLYEKKELSDFERFGLDKDKYEIISNKIKELKFPDKISEIKENLPKNISYMHIKMTLVKMKMDVNTLDNSLINEFKKFENDIIKVNRDYLELSNKFTYH